MSDTPRYGHPEANLLRAFKIRILQALARSAPGGAAMRVRLHRARGVKIGDNVYIGYDSILETSKPWLIEIEDDALLGVRTTIIAHFNGAQGVRIGKAAYIGPCSVILPNVVIGHGAVVSAGSVVTRSVPPLTVVQGNPAVAVATISKPMGWMSVKAFAKQLRPIAPASEHVSQPPKVEP
jgi:carbonic anhydrase/acetyltransferase-like protein (isoleucine patch superfamily)